MNNAFRSTKSICGLAHPLGLSRAEWLESLLRMLTTERRYSPTAARRFRLAMWVLDQARQ